MHARLPLYCGILLLLVAHVLCTSIDHEVITSASGSDSKIINILPYGNSIIACGHTDTPGVSHTLFVRGVQLDNHEVTFEISSAIGAQGGCGGCVLQEDDLFVVFSGNQYAFPGIPEENDQKQNIYLMKVNLDDHSVSINTIFSSEKAIHVNDIDSFDHSLVLSGRCTDTCEIGDDKNIDGSFVALLDTPDSDPIYYKPDITIAGVTFTEDALSFSIFGLKPGEEANALRLLYFDKKNRIIHHHKSWDQEFENFQITDLKYTSKYTVVLGTASGDIQSSKDDSFKVPIQGDSAVAALKLGDKFTPFFFITAGDEKASSQGGSISADHEQLLLSGSFSGRSVVFSDTEDNKMTADGPSSVFVASVSLTDFHWGDIALLSSSLDEVESTDVMSGPDCACVASSGNLSDLGLRLSWVDKFEMTTLSSDATPSPSSAMDATPSPSSPAMDSIPPPSSPAMDSIPPPSSPAMDSTPPPPPAPGMAVYPASASMLPSGYSSIVSDDTGLVLGTNPSEQTDYNTTTIVVTVVLVVLVLLLILAYFLYSKYWKTVAPEPDLHRFTKMEQQFGEA